MRWIDPTDCAAARECLERGNAIEAARLLLASIDRDHRAARRLLLEISARLAAQAGRDYERGEVLVAWEAIHCAEQCAALQGEAAALRQRIARHRSELQQNQAWHDQRLQEARAWAAAGRVHSALHRLDPLTEAPEVQRLRVDLEERLASFERYLNACRDHLDWREFDLARGHLDQARAIMPANPEVLRLARALREAAPPSAVAQSESGPARRIDQRGMTFALGDHALVVLAPEVVVGNPLGEGVHVPLLSRVHRRHALILRDRGRYRITPCGAGYAVAVNGQPVTGPRELADGDCLELGGPHCAWVFRLPVTGSGTAVLEQAQPSAEPVQTPDGSAFRRLVLADEAVHIRPRSPAHLVLTDLPCEALLLRWSEAGLVAAVQGGTLAVGGAEAASDTTSAPVWLPGQLVIQGNLDEAERLGRAFLTGFDPSDTLRLNLRDPFATLDPIP